MKIAISGYGRMGRMVESVLREKGIECAGVSEDIQSFDRKLASGSVCIDFTVPDAFRKNYRFLADTFKAVVVGTTGWYDMKDEVLSYFREKGTPMIYASNFSLGVNVLFIAAETVAGLLGRSGDYSPYIVEKHHCHKLDAPSGTAVTLASAVEKGMGANPDIQSVRCGEIPGIHTVCFEGHSDRIVIEHEAFSREGFARGAVQAALMTENLDGVYEFKDLLKI